MDADLVVLPLHKMPEYTLSCCRLINSEWPRSETARRRGLECSNDNLPTSLILVKKQNVIGHTKLSRIPSDPNACFIESVVIAQDLRGLGLGTYLMKKTEEYCKTVLNLSEVYLSTKGQEMFYGKLGYTECEPVSIYGCWKFENQIDTPKVIKEEVNCPPPPPMPTSKPLPFNIKTNKTFMKKTLK